MSKSDLVDIDAELVFETDDAFLIWDGSESFESGRHEVWVAKKHVENNGDGTFTMPEWLATDKGLV